MAYEPVGNEGFNVYAHGILMAPVRLAVNGAILADSVQCIQGDLRLHATPRADPFPLLQGAPMNAPEIATWANRNWSYVCPLGAHPF